MTWAGILVALKLAGTTILRWRWVLKLTPASVKFARKALELLSGERDRGTPEQKLAGVIQERNIRRKMRHAPEMLTEGKDIQIIFLEDSLVKICTMAAADISRDMILAYASDSVRNYRDRCKTEHQKTDGGG